LSDYAKLKDSLNTTLSQFNTKELRQNTETKEDYDTFVDIRKDLTAVYKSGQHLLKQIKEFKMKGHLNNIKTNTSIIPISIPLDDFEIFRKEIETTTRVLGRSQQNYCATRRELLAAWHYSIFAITF